MREIKLKLTYHALKQMAERAINKEQIKKAIRMGMKVRQKDGFLATYGYVQVAYKIIGKNCYKIKTVMIK